MDAKTGVIFDGDAHSLKEVERDLGRKLIPLTREQAEELRGRTMEERRGYARRLQARRRANRRARKARRRSRRQK